jgi:biotin transport system substrate-specific component
VSSFALAPSRRVVLADLLPGSRVRDVALIVGGAGLTGLAAQVSVHTSLSPVPFTLQTLAVLFVGAALGSVRGVLSMIIYAAAGSLGVPWFSSHSSGWGGPTIGYILGFIVSAAVVGELARRGNDRHVVSTVGLMALGSALVYAVGASWLAHDLHLSASVAIDKGVTPFLIGDAIKIAVAALVFPAAWRLARGSAR